MNKEFLKKLLNAPSPSGCEFSASQRFLNYCSENFRPGEEQKLAYNYTTETDKIGNSYVSVGKGPIKVMISAHIDEIAGQIQYISEEGLISFVRSGGLDKKIFPGSEVLIFSPELNHGTLFPGVIGKKPIHLEETEERSSVSALSDYKVDLGYETRQEILDLGISIGDYIIFPRPGENIDFGKNCVKSPGLDDKIGLFVVAEILQNLIRYEKNIDWLDKYTVYFVATVQEELGLRGATVATQRIKPDISIDLDVTFATDGGIDVKKSEHGEVYLGKGCVIQYGADKSRRLGRLFKDISKNSNIPTQINVSGPGGTNTDAIQLFGGDCETILISIPNRNMHTPVEICDYRDVQAAIDIITEAIMNCSL